MQHISKTDQTLLAEIQQDCRISNQDLAECAQLSASACWRRVRALEDAGVITGYGARIDRGKLGLEFAAMTHVSLTRHDARHVEVFVAAVQARAEVLDCFATTGAADYHLRVVCRDVAAYNDFLIPSAGVHWGVIFAVLAVIIGWFVMRYHVFGFRLRLLGD